DILPIYLPERNGDIRHSLADVSKAEKLLAYQPAIKIEEGLRRTWDWFKRGE
ncbi:MAG: LPS biosynthesis protein WbpP, partial [Verrucomicrobia bacterium]|nr:LPS biosynthesis protein WbpP [Cytophagales bacterium]